MVHIERIIDYTIPLYGNKRLFPYGHLLIHDDIIGKSKAVEIKEDGAKQYFTFNRKRYYVRNEGTLYAPRFKMVEG